MPKIDSVTKARIDDAILMTKVKSNKEEKIPTINVRVYGPAGSGKRYIALRIRDELSLHNFVKATLKKVPAFTPEQETAACAKILSKVPYIRVMTKKDAAVEIINPDFGVDVVVSGPSGSGKRVLVGLLQNAMSRITGVPYATAEHSERYRRMQAGPNLRIAVEIVKNKRRK